MNVRYCYGCTTNLSMTVGDDVLRRPEKKHGVSRCHGVSISFPLRHALRTRGDAGSHRVTLRQENCQEKKEPLMQSFLKAMNWLLESNHIQVVGMNIPLAVVLEDGVLYLPVNFRLFAGELNGDGHING